MTAGEIIKEERQNKGLNRKEFAMLSGISYNTIKAIEDGKNSGNWTTCERLLNALGYEIILMKNAN